MSNKEIKCVIWDLDDTIWEGTLLEDKDVVLKPKMKKIIESFDRLGIIQSIASKNFQEDAINKLKQFQIEHYFIYPKIDFSHKSDMITEIIKAINISEDTVAFIDDQFYELEEVSRIHREILCIHIDSIDEWLNHARFSPKVITEDTKMRRVMYQNDIQRNMCELEHRGTKETFLQTLDIKLSISKAKKGDLDRMLELTERTNQLNTTGYVYSYDELDSFIESKQHILFVIGVTDRFGTSGKVGLVLLSKNETSLTIDLFIMSCRVISRGIGTMVINYILKKVKELKLDMYARFIPTGRNKMMQMAYVMTGFKFHHENNGCQFWLNDLSRIQPIPDYIELIGDVVF